MVFNNRMPAFTGLVVSVGLMSAALSANAQASRVPDSQKSPQVSDLLGAVKRMNGPDSIIIDEEIDGIKDAYNDGIKGGDHVQGMTMTPDGRIVLSYSRTGDNYCGGILISSSAFDPALPDKKLEWHMECNTVPAASGGTTGAVESHPSNVQASGNIIIVGSHGGSRFFELQPDGSFVRLAHLDMATGGRDASGLVYNHIEDRFYALNADGPVTAGEVPTQICRTPQGASLTDPGTQFGECRTFDAYTSGQASNLVMQDDGTMYLVSLFSSTEFWPDGTDWPEVIEGIEYGAWCLQMSHKAGLGLGHAMPAPYSDQIYVSEIDYANQTATKVHDEDIGRTQALQTCVQNRPAFRFSGATATINGYNGLIGLWSGRQNPPVATQTDAYEFAYQLLPSGSNLTEYKVDIDCHVDDLENEGTNSEITATFYDETWRELGSSKATEISDTNCKFRWISIESEFSGEAEFVKVSTNGEDGFMIDRIQLYKDGDKIKEYGLNNDKGWCLSTDPSDGTGSWKYASNGICVTYHTWSYSGATVSGNPYDNALANRGSTTVRTYSVGIDCQVDDIGNEGTTGTITATFYNATGTEIGSGSVSEIANGITGCERIRDVEIEAVTTGEAETVKISTNSGDGFMIDRIHLYREGEFVRTYGANNDKGWCLSTQESDGEGSWSYAANGICVPYHSWSYSGATVSGNPYDTKLANQGGGTINTYAVDIDCDVSGGVSNEHTGGTLTVIFQDSRGRVLGRSALGGGEDGPFGCTDLEASVQVRGEAGIVRFETNSSDAAMLDEITVLKNGDEIKVFGDSDDKGWCLSTQASDANGNWKGHIADGVCRPAVQWSF